MSRPTSCLLALCSSLALAESAGANDIVTSFEFFDFSGDFTLGNSPRTARFLNGRANSTGALSLYHSGMNAWMILPGQTGTIEFSAPASVDFFYTDEAASVASVLTVFDPFGNVLTTVNGSNSGFIQVTQSNVGRITLQNNDATTMHTVIDDLTACFGVDVGTPFCSATMNSTGLTASLAGMGTGSVGANDLVLVANGVPKVPGIGIFIAGPGQAQIPFFNGFLCIDPNGLQRINQVTPASNNTVIQALDFTGANTGTAPLNVVVGQAYNFQYWFRDPTAGGANANFSDGLSVSILP